MPAKVFKNEISEICGREPLKIEVIWSAKVIENGRSKICGRQPLKNFTLSILQYFVPNTQRLQPGNVDKAFHNCSFIISNHTSNTIGKSNERKRDVVYSGDSSSQSQ